MRPDVVGNTASLVPSLFAPVLCTANNVKIVPRSLSIRTEEVVR